jgi:5-methylcytosine-specific restriction endonuclease McrA
MKALSYRGYRFPPVIIQHAVWLYLRFNWGRHFPWLRSRMCELQGNKCCWCGCTMEDDGPRKRRPTFDHIDPLSRGGRDAPDNIAIACYECNQDHDNKPVLYRPVMPWHSELLLAMAA